MKQPRYLNPKRVNISVDADVLDKFDTEYGLIVDRFIALMTAREINVVVAGGVRDQIQHPHTPQIVKELMLPQIFNLRPGQNTSQQKLRQEIRSILKGNARSDQHDADASHLAEAAETGCGYFIARDKRYFKKIADLKRILPPSLQIVSLEEFLNIYDDWQKITTPHVPAERQK